MAGPTQRTPKGSYSSSSKSQPSTKSGAIDPRFANIQTDPRFRLPSRKNQKVKLDSRFERLLADDAFAQKASVDRYGRKLDAGSGRRNLERFYRMDEGENPDDAEGDDDDDDDTDAQTVGKGRRARAKVDPARQGGFDESSSDEDDTESSEDESDLDDSDAESAAGDEELDEEALAAETAGREARGADVPEGEVSARIAVVNMDWDNVRAVDLMAVAASFCPVGGRLLKSVVYPSEFGRERMEKEEIEGPPKELFNGNNSKRSRRRKKREEEDEGEEDDAAVDARIRKELLEDATEESSEIDSRALRAYQLSRLQYYYAVMTFDSAATAHAVYIAMDGREYLSSANFFDLRFVPDDTSFEGDKPRDDCSRVPEGYRPSEFVTEALTHSKVKLTWDADDTERKEVQKRAFGRQEMDENDLRAYVGSDSSDEEEDPSRPSLANVEVIDGETGEATTQPKLSKAEEARRKMRVALGLPVDEAPSKKSKQQTTDQVVGDMQITFSAGLSSNKPDKKSTTGVFENTLEDVREETTLEKYKRKEKDRKARRKEKAKAARDGVDVAPASEEEGQSSSSEAEDEIVLDETMPPGSDAEDDPFNDPFFTDPSAANATARKASKAAKRKSAEAAAAVDAVARAKDKAQLELLMAADRAENGVSNAEHFDMAAVRKAEKASEGKKKGKWAKKHDARKSKDGKIAIVRGGEQDGFEVDVADSRFKGLFESHEFAIDPSNPRFSGTKAMKKLLEEGRKKRKMDVDAADGSKGNKSEADTLVTKAKKRKI